MTLSAAVVDELLAQAHELEWNLAVMREAQLRRERLAPDVVCEPCRLEQHLDCVRPCTCRVRVRAVT